LVARPGSKAPNDNLGDDDPGYRGTGLTQVNRTIWFGILDDLVFMTPDVVLAFLVLGHEDVEGGLWASRRLAPIVLLPLAIFQTFWLIILGGRSSPMMTSLPVVDSA
jgi:hypothetical protein